MPSSGKCSYGKVDLGDTGVYVLVALGLNLYVGLLLVCTCQHTELSDSIYSVTVVIFLDVLRSLSYRPGRGYMDSRVIGIEIYF